MPPNLQETLRRPSVVVLLVANLVPVFGVLFFNWDVVSLLQLYWAENVAVGLVNVLKLLTNRHSDTVTGQKIFMAGFFSVHYGGFCMGHAAFVFGGALTREPSFGLPFGNALDYLFENPLLFLGFFGSHLFSFFTNYLGKEESKATPLGKVMFLPYGRIFVLHITIIFGGFAIMALGSPIILLLILTLAKTAGDLFFHLREHRDTPTLLQPELPGK